MTKAQLKSISPLDGRYANKTSELNDIFSEYGLIQFRVLIEIRWLQHLSNIAKIKELKKFNKKTNKRLNDVIENFDISDAHQIKRIEKATNHDVKAVEYFIKRLFAKDQRICDFIHFGCTSEDINNIAYGLMLTKSRKEILLPKMQLIHGSLNKIAKKYKSVPMLSRTHGQTASPTTVGKEFANVLSRLTSTTQDFKQVEILGKFNGAVGNYNAHFAAYPTCNWPKITTSFIKSLGLKPNMLTTQIEPHDWIAKYCHTLIRYNIILLDLSRDIWSYISLGYFKQRLNKHEVGSSTMPHKINPIDFENAEGNLGLANSLLSHFAEKLPISRLQRDLTDSTVQRNFGVALGYTLIAMKSLLKGIDKLEVDKIVIKKEINESWEVIGEAIQTVMRRYGIPEPYEKLKKLTRGNTINKEILHNFVNSLEIPKEAKIDLLRLTPSNYIGLAKELSKEMKLKQ